MSVPAPLSDDAVPRTAPERRRSLVRRAFVLRVDGMGRRVASGAGYKMLGIGVRTVVTIGSTAILARQLSPAEFGHIAMATVVTEFAALFGAFGFTNVLIQRRVNTRLQLDTVFWATLAVGVLLAAAVFLLSFVAGSLFADAQVGPLLRWLSLAFVFNSLTAVPWVVISRLMRFGTEFWVQTATVLIRAASAVACAYAGMGVWSLVVGALVGSVASVVLNFACVPYLPRWRFHAALLTGTWRTSGSYFGSSVLYYLNMNVDLLLIGRFLGAAPLGYYQNARSLTDEIRARIAMPIQHVLFPAFSALQGERERYQQLVLRAGQLLAAVVVPIGLGISANATELVLVLYGEKWRPMIPVMTMMGIGGAVRAATAIASPLFNANDRVGLALRYNVVGTVLTVAGVAFAMPHGLGAVAATLAGVSFYALISFRAAFGLIGLGVPDMMRVLLPPAVASGVMWFVIAASARFTAGVDLPGARLAVQVLLGAFTYIVVLHLQSRSYFEEVRRATAGFRRSA